MGYVSHALAVMCWGCVALFGICLSIVTFFVLIGVLLLALLTLLMLGYAFAVSQSVDQVTRGIGMIKIGLSWKILCWYFVVYLGLGAFLLPSLRTEDTWVESLLTVLDWPFELTLVALRNMDRPFAGGRIR